MTPQEHDLIMQALDRVHKGQDSLAEGQARLYERMDHLDDCIDETRATLVKRMDNLESSLEAHVVTEAQQFGQVMATLKSAVPDGDFDGHRLYHVGQMNRWNFWHKIKSGVTGKVLEVAVIGVGGWAVITLWGGFKIVVSN